MIFPILSLILMHVLLPGYLIYSLWRSTENSRYDWLIQVLYVGSLVAFVVLAGRWDWFSYYARFLWIIPFAVAAWLSFRRVRDRPFFQREGWRRWVTKPLEQIELVLILVALVITLRGYVAPTGGVRLEFPLQGGWYYIMHGGSSVLVNRHHPVTPQQYALDIGELNAAGLRARGIYPTELTAYEIFGEPIYSPCDGTVEAAVDGVSDNIPPATNTDELAGNYVFIACRGAKVLLAHLKEGSVLVSNGDAVTVGQRLGEVGNSGNSTEPHLHFHATGAETDDALGGVGVPIFIAGDFPVRNDTFRRE